MAGGPGAHAPTATEVRRGLTRRVLLPTALLWLAVTGVGLLLVNVVDLHESGIEERFEGARTSLWNSVTGVVSAAASTPIAIASCVVIVLLIWALSRQWWLAIVPALALALEAAVFITSSLLIGRDRPEVEHLDDAPPTSSFPSGHTGAASALYLSVALVASRIRITWLRVTVQVLCVLAPVSVALARVYRGMHHPTDVAAGLLVGLTCALIAWNWLPREKTPAVEETDEAARAA